MIESASESFNLIPEENKIRGFLQQIVEKLQTSFLETKLKKGVNLSWESELEELYQEYYNNTAFLQKLIEINYFLAENFELRRNDFSNKMSYLENDDENIKDDIIQTEKELEDFEKLRKNLEKRNSNITNQITKIENIYNENFDKYNNLQEEIINLADFEEKLDQLNEDHLLVSDLLLNLKQENIVLKNKSLDYQKKIDGKVNERKLYKAKYLIFEKKIQHMEERQNLQSSMNEDIENYNEFLKTKIITLSLTNYKLEKEKKRLQKKINHGSYFSSDFTFDSSFLISENCEKNEKSHFKRNTLQDDLLDTYRTENTQRTTFSLQIDNNQENNYNNEVNYNNENNEFLNLDATDFYETKKKCNKRRKNKMRIKKEQQKDNKSYSGKISHFILKIIKKLLVN